MVDQEKPASPSAASEPGPSKGKSTEPVQADASTSVEPSVLLPPQHWAQIAEIEHDDDTDADSALGTDAASSTASMTSSILKYRTIQGRTYHSDQGNTQYWGSNDEPQIELMDIAHHVLTIGLGGKLYLAPLAREKIKQVLDIGTGSGIWAIDFADECPTAQVVGTDISPSQPTWVPPNLRFEIEDFTREWTFPSDRFDFVHMRWLFGSVKSWSSLSSEAFRVCAPGGWVETLEASTVIRSDDNTVAPDSAMGHWGNFFIEGSKKLGASVTVVEDGTQRKVLEEAGFINIQEFDFKNPIGGWSDDPAMKEMGPYSQFGLEKDSEGFILYMAHILGWTRDEIMLYLTQFHREIRSGKHHGYFTQKVVWGQKPE